MILFIWYCLRYLGGFRETIALTQAKHTQTTSNKTYCSVLQIYYFPLEEIDENTQYFWHIMHKFPIIPLIKRKFFIFFFQWNKVFFKKNFQWFSSGHNRNKINQVILWQNYLWHQAKYFQWMFCNNIWFLSKLNFF